MTLLYQSAPRPSLNTCPELTWKAFWCHLERRPTVWDWATLGTWEQGIITVQGDWGHHPSHGVWMGGGYDRQSRRGGRLDVGPVRRLGSWSEVVKNTVLRSDSPSVIQRLRVIHCQWIAQPPDLPYTKCGVLLSRTENSEPRSSGLLYFSSLFPIVVIYCCMASESAGFVGRVLCSFSSLSPVQILVLWVLPLSPSHWEDTPRLGCLLSPDCTNWGVWNEWGTVHFTGHKALST
jgi:hypothetical protein